MIDIPTGISSSLGSDFFIKTVFPGLIAFLAFFEPIIYPLISEFWDPLSIEYKFVVWIFLGIFIGLLFAICEMYIYQFFEGIRFWPQFLWDWKYERIQEHFQKLDKKLENLIDQKEKKSKELSSTELKKLSLEISKLSARAREFPPDPGKENFTRRYPARPTRFGNIICEYENYPFNRYGIHMVIFWNYLRQLLPKRIKEDLRLRGAIVDLLVNFCATSFLYIIVGPMVLFFQKDTWILISNHFIPVKSFVYLIISIIVFRSLYDLTINHLRDYGRFVKSIVDLNREKLARKLGIEIKIRYHRSKKEFEKEKSLWEKHLYYYLDYIFLDEWT